MVTEYEVNSMMQQFEDMMGMGLFATLLNEIPSLLISVAVYIFTALALYTIAKRRGIHRPWLAWIPFANTWLLGCVSDQYRSVAHGERKNRRKILLTTEILTSVLSIVMLALVVVMLVNVLAFGLDHMADPDDMMPTEVLSAIMGPMVAVMLLCLPLLVAAIVHAVFTIIALYDIYKSCDPGNAVLYLVLSIFISYTRPIFLFICRNKDDGMPPREPQYPPVQGFQPPYGQPPVYSQPPQPKVSEEPWEQERE